MENTISKMHSPGNNIWKEEETTWGIITNVGKTMETSFSAYSIERAKSNPRVST